MNKNSNKLIVIGHRGACGHVTENTLVSFSKAIDLGVDMIEFDVRLTRDNHVVVFHDRKTKRMTGKRGSVRSKNLVELAEHKLSDNSSIPTLISALDSVNRRVPVNIEIKDGGMTDKVAQIVNHYIVDFGWPADKFNISSFRHKELVKFKKYIPAVPISILFHRVPKDVGEYVQKFGVYSVNLWKNHATREVVDDIKVRDRNVKVFIYTINEQDELNKMIDLGVDGVFSDYPDRIKEWAADLTRGA